MKFIGERKRDREPSHRESYLPWRASANSRKKDENIFNAIREEDEESYYGKEVRQKKEGAFDGADNLGDEEWGDGGATSNREASTQKERAQLRKQSTFDSNARDKSAKSNDAQAKSRPVVSGRTESGDENGK